MSQTVGLVKSVANYNPGKFTLKRELSNTASVTNPVSAQLEMAEKLSGISMDCIMEGCQAVVSLSTMTGR